MASYKRTYKYALAKYKLASQLCSVSISDLNHNYSNKYLGVSLYDIDHVYYAYSIVIAYSVIEEIEFEIRASNERPSKIKGKWNPEVRKELEVRLSKGGVDLSDKFDWLLRGTPTRIKNPKEIKDASKSPWSKGLYCRDRLVDIADAIYQANFLRSKISAHRLRSIARSLTPYDAENVRQLARRLILERLGLWMEMIHKAHEIN